MEAGATSELLGIFTYPLSPVRTSYHPFSPCNSVIPLFSLIQYSTGVSELSGGTATIVQFTHRSTMSMQSTPVLNYVLWQEELSGLVVCAPSTLLRQY
jgi:hypothetical protein